MKNIIAFLLLFLCIGCIQKKFEYYPNGTISKEYFSKNGKLDGAYIEYDKEGRKTIIHNYVEGIKTDSSIYYQNNQITQIDYYLKEDTIFTKLFYPNQKVQAEGKYFNGIKVGKWTYYQKKGYIDKVFEYINLSGKQYTNQGWHFNRNGDTIKEFGNNFSYKIVNKNIRIKDTVIIQFYYKPLLALNSDVVAYMSTKIEKDFKNIDQVELDTTYFESANNGFQEFIFSKPGKINLRGFIEESVTKISEPENTNIRRIYFDIPIDIK